VSEVRILPCTPIYKYMMQNLLSSYKPNQTLLFSGSDDERFYKNRKKLGKDWEYRDKHITYNYNEYGFRTKSFDKIAWQDSVVILGCSHVEGTGLAEEDTIASQLERIIDMPVVNLGLAGAAVDIAAWNSLILHDHYPHPKAVVQLWTGLARYTDYCEDLNRVKCKLPMLSSDYLVKHNWNFRSKLYVKADRALWKDKIPYYEACFDIHTARELEIDHCKFYDQARDLVHGGVETAKLAAEKIAKSLTLSPQW
jgi:hypothetical protein